MGNKKLDCVYTVRMIAIVLATLICILCNCTAYAADDDSNLIDICEILTRSNMRSSPSQNGRWVATIPEGAYVLIVDEGESGFYHVEYGEYEGYVYAGCISAASQHRIDDYTGQFEGYIPTRNLANSVYSVASSNVDSESGGSGRQSWSDRTIGDDQGTTQQTTNIIDEYVEASTSPERQIFIPDTAAQYAMDHPNANATSTSGMGLGLTTFVSSSSNITDNVEAQPQVEIYTAKAEVLADVVLRTLPAVDSAKISTISKDTRVNVIDEGENGFIHVSVNGSDGYIYSRCLDLSDVDFDRLSGIMDIVVADQTPGNGASSSSARSRTLASSVFTLVGVTASETREISNQVATGTANQAIDTVDRDENVAHEIRTSVNMRSLPNSESEWLATIPTGSDVDIIGQSNDGYTLVQYNGIRGYVLESCIGDVVDSIDISMLGSDPVLFNITAYCSCQLCCGSYSPEVRGGEAHTATGTVPQEGRTIAVDPGVIPYGTQIYIEGMGTYTAEDCGGSINGNHIDIYFETHEAAIAFGSRRLYVSIVQ